MQQAIDHANRKAGGTLTKEQALAMAAQAFVEGGDGSRRTKRTMLFKCDACAAVFMDAGGERVRVEAEAANDADPITPDAPARSRAGAAAPEMDSASIVYDDRSRHIPMAVQREVWARHRGKCAVPGCCNRLFLQFHHLDPWAENGTHDPKRITLVCGVREDAARYGHS